MSLRFLLVGAGGHAKVVVEAMRSQGHDVAAYVDPKRATWLDARWIEADTGHDGTSADLPFAIGFAGTDPAKLARRLTLADDYLRRGRAAPPIVHRSAVVSASAVLEPASVVFAGAVVQPGAHIGRGTIVNTRAVVEHGARIGAGTHVAPGAIVLADTTVGSCCMIGAGAVVLAQKLIGDSILVRAVSRYPNGND